MIGAVFAGFLLGSLLPSVVLPARAPLSHALFAQIIETNPKPPIEQTPAPPTDQSPKPSIEQNPKPPIEQNPTPPIEQNPKPPVEKRSMLSGAACGAIGRGPGAGDPGRVWCARMPGVSVWLRAAHAPAPRLREEQAFESGIVASGTMAR
jgi:hypothetical protein